MTQKKQTLGVNDLLKIAHAVKELEYRGEDLTGLKIGYLLRDLRKVASDQLLPEAFVAFCGSLFLLQRIDDLPLPEQRRLAAGNPALLLGSAADGTTTHRQADPLGMTRD